jgi:hypothetical protein
MTGGRREMTVIPDERADNCLESILFRIWQSPLSNILSLKSLKRHTLEMAPTR